MRLLRVWGIDIKINFLLCLLFIILFFTGYLENILLSFLVVLLHEGAHTVIARLLNYNIENIEIFPFGGVARVEETIALDPRHEMLIALAGPVFNFILVIVAFQIGQFIEKPHDLLNFFIYTNFIIGIFNLIPIIPLDGGRIIRAYLSFLVGVKRSTKIVVRFSKIFSVLLFIGGCFIIQYDILNIFIPILSIFLFIAAHREHQMAVFVFMKEITQKKQYLLAQGILNTKYLVAIKTTSLKEVMNQFVPRKYHVVTVMDQNCKVVGVITESEILEGMIKYGMNASLEKLLTHK